MQKINWYFKSDMSLKFKNSSLIFKLGIIGSIIGKL